AEAAVVTCTVRFSVFVIGLEPWFGLSTLPTAVNVQTGSLIVAVQVYVTLYFEFDFSVTGVVPSEKVFVWKLLELYSAARASFTPASAAVYASWRAVESLAL